MKTNPVERIGIAASMRYGFCRFFPEIFRRKYKTKRKPRKTKHKLRVKTRNTLTNSGKKSDII